MWAGRRREWFHDGSGSATPTCETFGSVNTLQGTGNLLNLNFNYLGSFALGIFRQYGVLRDEVLKTFDAAWAQSWLHLARIWYQGSPAISQYRGSSTSYDLRIQGIVAYAPIAVKTSKNLLNMFLQLWKLTSLVRWCVRDRVCVRADLELTWLHSNPFPGTLNRSSVTEEIADQKLRDSIHFRFANQEGGCTVPSLWVSPTGKLILVEAELVCSESPASSNRVRFSIPIIRSLTCRDEIEVDDESTKGRLPSTYSSQKACLAKPVQVSASKPKAHDLLTLFVGSRLTFDKSHSLNFIVIHEWCKKAQTEIHRVWTEKG